MRELELPHNLFSSCIPYIQILRDNNVLILLIIENNLKQKKFINFSIHSRPREARLSVVITSSLRGLSSVYRYNSYIDTNLRILNPKLYLYLYSSTLQSGVDLLQYSRDMHSIELRDIVVIPNPNSIQVVRYS